MAHKKTRSGKPRVGVAVSLPKAEDLADPGAIAAYEGVLTCGEQAVEALKSAGYEAFLVRVYRDIAQSIAELREGNAQVVVNFVEELAGEARGEADFAEALEREGMPFTGSSGKTLLLTLDKGNSKRFLAQRGVPVPRYVISTSGKSVRWPEAQLPAIVKPDREDGSVGVEIESVCYDLPSLRARVDHVAQQFEQPAIVEEYIDGREIAAPMLEGAELPLSEIEFSGPATRADGRPMPRILTFRAKWVPGSDDDRASRPRCPAVLQPELESRIREISRRAFKACGVRDYGRVDFRVDREGRPFVLEVNANPDLSADAGFVRAARFAQFDLPKLYAHIVELAHARGAGRRAPVMEPASHLVRDGRVRPPARSGAGSAARRPQPTVRRSR
ncbi:MAG: hypothetical protein JNJ88_08060 [Planctomycetes bacterium]|nr:hypothetical protein [Planctomycetota bacterium]